MFYLLIGVLAILLVLLLDALIWRYRELQLVKRMRLEGPRPNILFGNLLDFLRVARTGKEKTPMILVNWHKKFGETFGYYLGVPYFRISTINKDIIKEVFIKQFSRFVDREAFSPMLDGFPLTESLLQIGKTGSKGYGWKEIRSIASPAFTSGKMKLMFSTIHERTETLVEILNKKTQENPMINIYDEFQALTMDVIGRTAFGVEANSLNDRNDIFYMQARHFIQNTNLENNLGFLIGFISRPMGYLLKPFSSLYKSQKVISENLRNVIEYRKKIIRDYKRVDLIQLLLEEDEERQKRENKPPMHIDTIVSVCFGFMIAGYETTSTALAFAAWFLAKHPEVQEQLSEDIKKLPNKNSVDYDTAMKMPFLNAIFKETLRLKSPVSTFTGRTCIEDTVVEGMEIKQGTRKTGKTQWTSTPEDS
ncbi:hypothetical protein FO519_003211 [Halicephalobus sp. NKZ332]|nr:hypothetical protein FO519_003211 [Halicephalobus sp. NKZ332]